MQDIRTIDIARENDATIKMVEDACHDTGFMYVCGHGISPDVIATIRTAVIRYFSRPLEDKLAEIISRDNYRGYIPTGFFSANAGGLDADLYEGYKLHLEVCADDLICTKCDLYGPNKWPDQPTGFKESILTYWRACDRVAEALLSMLTVILDVDKNWFLQKFEKPLTNMTLLHYPPQDENSDGFGIHPHKDTDALTILVPDKVGGLMVRARNSEDWIEVNAPDNALVVNIGDLLELWSGGYFVSTPHKVVNKSGAERYSFPYFVVPRFDTVVSPLCTPMNGFDRDAVHVGDVSREVWRTNWPDAVPSDPDLHLGTLAD